MLSSLLPILRYSRVSLNLVAKEEKEGTHDECEELGQAFWALEDDVSIEERRGELKEGEGETGPLCECGLVAELEDFLLDFGGKEGERRRGRSGHVCGFEAVVDGGRKRRGREISSLERKRLSPARSTESTHQRR